MSKSLFFLLAFLVLLRIGLYAKTQIQSLHLPKNTHLALIATLKNEPKISYGGQVLEIGDGKVYVDLYPRYRVGDRLQIEGETDDKGRLYGAKVEKVGREKSLGNYFSHLRGRISENIASLLPPTEATLVQGAVVGVDTISDKFKEVLVKTGTIHVVVVSGQNLMIVCGVFMSMIRYIGRRKTLLAATLAVFAYAFLTGFEPPVVRASLMVLTATLAVYFGRESLPLWNLMVAALVIIFIWPSAIWEVSFQLTFAATLGIMTLGRYLSEIFKAKDGSLSSTQGASLSEKVLYFIKTLIFQNAAIATSAYIFTAPIILFHFGKSSLVSPLANIFAVEVVFPVMILGFLTVISSFIFMPLAQIFAFFAYVPVFYFVKVVEVFAKIPVGEIRLGEGNLVFVIGFYILLFSLIWIWRRTGINPKF